MTPHSDPRIEELIAAARRARDRAHCPYSGMAVGAALGLSDDEIVTGVNVENASFGLTICAERVAAVRAIAGGRRDFVAIAIAGGTAEPIQPCGACRQFLAEFAPELVVVSVGEDGSVVESSLDVLLPGRFRLGEAEGPLRKAGGAGTE